MFKTTICWNPLICAIAVTLEKAIFDLTLASCPSVLYTTYYLSLCILLGGSWHFRETEKTMLVCQSMTSLGRLFFCSGNHNSHHFRHIVFSSTSA